ncbi:calcium-binding protein [Aquipseudomonas guryensis]|uniref:Haemolysin-type calcium binding-related domain-containing protein n=1 Tax=Aquipseudomonas guryensis TaxID=2759165 RepID=A0A7W4DE02_9GAMM|nr:calcium-binding protein [Pseudomonas guryensis]MBB1520845.1 hypothetical protein [Pseudomonas guryensis]
MSFSNVESKVVISGFSPDESAAILAAIRTIYEDSPTARGIVDDWLGRYSDNIEVMFSEGEFRAEPDFGELYLDLEQIANACFIDDNGTAVKDTLVTAIAHELVHALTGWLDLPTSTDYKGETVPIANIIYTELCLGAQQNSYISYDYDGSILSLGFEYTGGAAIDRSVIVDLDNIDWDSSPAGDSIDLLIGDTRQNSLSAGEGNDYIYGNGGNDTLDGGVGTDKMYGGEDDDTYIVDNESDTVHELAGQGKDTVESSVTFTLGEDVENLTLFGNEAIDGTGNSLANEITGNSGNNRLTGGDDSDTLAGAGGDDILHGDVGNDFLDGGANNDELDGGQGVDTLIGSEGQDTLSGGEGNDRYEFHSGDGSDKIIDSDGQGSIWVDGVRLGGGKEVLSGAGIWKSADEKFTYYSVSESDGSVSLFIKHGSDLISVKNYQRGALGLVFTAADAVVSSIDTTFTKVGDLKPIDFDPITLGIQAEYDALRNVLVQEGVVEDVPDALYGTGGNDLIKGLNEHDHLYGEAGEDHLQGGSGMDTLFGGAGADLLDGGIDEDRLDGGEGADTLIGGNGKGGYWGPNGGEDVLIGGGGDDQLYANAVISIEEIKSQEGGTASRGDWLSGGLGNDLLVGYIGNDVLFGGDGQDTLWGGAGDDVLEGDNNFVPNALLWDVRQYGNMFDRIWSPITILDSDAPGGNDFIFGGAGNDWIAGHFGNDWIFGESGQDTLGGTDGDDYLFGGGEDDYLTGDYGKSIYDFGSTVVVQGNDYLDGGAGNDWLQGEGGRDELLGGNGNDILHGDATYLIGTEQSDDRLDGGAGNDTFYGGGGNDFVDGGDDHDLLFGDYVEADLAGQFHGKDTLIGGLGRDTIYGAGGNDELHGGGDADELGGDLPVAYLSVAYHGADRLYGDAGNDTLWGGGGSDTLDGGADDDQLVGDSSDLLEVDHGNDVLLGGAGQDTLWGGGGNDTLEGGIGDDMLTGDAGSDVYRFSRGWGQDTIENYNSSAGDIDLIEFTGILSSQIEIVRYGYSLLLTLKGTTDIVTVSDYFMNEAASNYSLQIRFADGEMWTVDDIKELVLQGTDNNDFLTGYSSNDVLAGGLGNDVLSGLDGNDNISGGSGNDTLKGQIGDDLLEGGIGNDLLSGGSGSDTYRFSRGWGQDTLDNYDSSTNKLDKIEFSADISSSDIRIARASNGADLLLTLNGASDIITIKNYFVSYAVEEIRFANGAVWTEEDVRASLFTSTDGADTINGTDLDDLIKGGLGNDVIYGLEDYDRLFGGAGNDRLEGGDSNDFLSGEAGNDTLIGDDGNDTLDGGDGSDLLMGYAGSDVYRFSRGWGQDRVSNYDTSTGKTDAIEFAAGIAAGDILVSSWDNDLILSLKDSTDKVTVTNYFLDDGTGVWALEEVRFADGTTWNFAQVKAMSLLASAGNDALTGYVSADVIDGGHGDDFLWGQAGDDQLLGGAGSDQLYGGSGNDTLDGGVGDDRLDGGEGNDVYLFGRNSGQDIISSSDYGVGKHDVIKLDDSISPSDILIAQQGNNLILLVRGTNDRLTIENYFLEGAGGRIEAINFDDGTVWDYTIVSELPRLSAIFGGAGTQNLTGGIADEMLDGGSGDDQLNGGGGNDVLSGGDGVDGLYGGDGDDTLSGGAGYDYLDGGAGNDTYFWGRGQGSDSISNRDLTFGKNDIIKLSSDIAPSDILVTCQNHVLYLTILDSGEQLRVNYYFSFESDDEGNYTRTPSVDEIHFADGTIWNFEDVRSRVVATSGDDNLLGSEADNILTGLEGNDALSGQGGNDTLDGGAGDDYLEGGTGNDVFLFGRGSGNDYINATSHVDGAHGWEDSVRFSPEINTADIEVRRSWYDLILTIRDTGEQLQISGYFQVDENGFHPEAVGVQFADGTQWDFDTVLSKVGATSGDDFLSGSGTDELIQGLAGDDYLFGEGGNDTLDGGAGNDNLDGGAGNDTYLFGRGAGSDTISSFDESDNKFDIIRLAADIALSDIEVSREDHDLLITIRDTGDQLRVHNYFPYEGAEGVNYEGVEQIHLGDGTVLDFDAVDTLLISPVGTEDDDLLYGSSQADFIQGLAGNDELYGGAGDDTLDGGAGDDTLEGGAGHDTYLFGKGSGNDTVYWRDEVADIQTIRLTGSLVAADFAVGREYGDLLLTIIETGEQLIVEGYFDEVDGLGPTGTYRVQIYFSNGDLLDFASVESELTPPLATEGDDYLYGLSSNDIIQALGGKDEIAGGLGNDTLDGGAGDDYVDGGAGNDLLIGGVGNDYLWGGAGDDVLNGGFESDLLGGGTGSDTYIINHVWNRTFEYTEGAEGGIDTVQSAINWSLGGNFENLLLTGNSAINGTGNELDNVLTGNSSVNTLTGNAGNDWLDGGAGNDSLVGGVGDDTYVVDSTFDNVIENADEGSDTIESGVTLTLGSHIENLILTGALALNGTGNSLDNFMRGNSAANALTGNVGNDRLDGGAGNDSLVGGVGDDTYVVDSTSDVVTENANEGLDTVESSVTLTLTANVENLSLIGSSNLNAAGNTLANTLRGNAGNNRLDGGAGVDSMFGGAGDDTYVVDIASDTVTENANEGLDTVESNITLTLANNIENLTLTGTNAINGTGNTLDNLLVGNSAINTLIGGAGNDRLDGKGGVDKYQGGTGNDTYVVDGATETVTESANEGIDTVESSVTLTLANNLENLTLTGANAINGTGNSLDNVLIGNSVINTLVGGAGNDRLDGKGGVDKYQGGAGNDTYVVDGTTETVTENANEGIDTVESSVTLTLGSNVENLTLTGTGALNGTGNTLNNTLIGNAGANSLTGAAGNDRLDGQGAADTLTGGTGNDTYVLGRGYGADTAVENDSTAGNTDIAQFLSGISTDQLWFRKLSNNLEVSVIGTSDKLTVKDWYLGNAYHVEQFKTADGKTLLDSQVQNLVNAMAAFAPPAAGQTSLPENYQASLASVIAANWQ